MHFLSQWNQTENQEEKDPPPKKPKHLETKLHNLHNLWVKRNSQRNKKYIELNENENTTYKNL